MAKQWMRACKLVVGTQSGSPNALDLSDFRIQFHVYQATTNNPKYADIRVYNVSATTKSKFIGEGQDVILQAGYQENIGTIFRGQVMQMVHRRESKTDTYLNILATTSDQAHQYAVLNASVAAGSTSQDRYNVILKAMAQYGVTGGTVSGLSENRLPRGRVLTGMCRNHLSDLAADNNCHWRYNEQNQVDMVSANAAIVEEDQAIVLNRETGMIGQPELTIGGLIVSAALNPALDWKKLIRLDNQSIQQELYDPDYGAAANNLYKSSAALSPNGYYIIMSVDHLGDTRGDAWQTSMVCIGKDAKVVPVSGATIISTAQ